MLSLSYTSRLILVSPALVLFTWAASGCGSDTMSWTFNRNNHSNQTIGNRSFLVHLPAKYSFNMAHPVVLSFHGYGETDENQEEITGFSQDANLIDDKGIIAVYPMAAYGPGKHNKPARAWAGAPYSVCTIMTRLYLAKTVMQPHDFGFVDAMIDSLENNLCIDSKRIYASGMSNGGGFVNLLACSANMAFRFAAFAPVSAALYSGTHPFNACNPGRTIPLINFHGTADRTIPYDGRDDDDSEDTPPIPEWREAWVVRNGCDASAPISVSHPYDGVIETTWKCGDNNETTVKGFEIEDGVHKWPSTAETSFDATPEQILPFFNQYSLS
ncbi:hypothetical protein C8R43DRAFT_894991 [Mycena crocata]|nr:hypothetical protein C8R43DRAFT_894991 [Mycena crocata]